MTDFVNSNDNRFIAVTFQYRVGLYHCPVLQENG